MYLDLDKRKMVLRNRNRTWRNRCSIKRKEKKKWRESTYNKNPFIKKESCGINIY